MNTTNNPRTGNWAIKLFCAIMAFALGSGICFAASSNDAGTSTAQFLKLGVGARASAMGEAFVGMADDSTAIYWNPAGLCRIEGGSLSLMHAVWFEGITYDWASCAHKIGNLGVFGIGIQALSYGSITGTDTTGLEMSSFNPSDLAVSLSYGNSIKSLLVGVNVKYISSTITNTATAYAADIGLMYPLMNDRLWLGAALQNEGTKMKFINEEDPLPINVKLGGAYALSSNWKVALDANAPVDNDIYFGVGSEYKFKLSGSMSAAGRLGYNTITKDTGGLNGISAGAGFTYLSCSIDYAFVPYGDLGDTQRISVSFKF